MAEDNYLADIRKYIGPIISEETAVPVKKVMEVITQYNKYLVKCLINESPVVAKDLELTILNAREKDVREKED